MNSTVNKKSVCRLFVDLAVAALFTVSIAMPASTIARYLQTAATSIPAPPRSAGRIFAPAQPQPILTPKAQPIQPFPPVLSAEITTLRARNRFFYNGNVHLPEVALTFDDGPNPMYTPQVLAILQKHNIKATFFDVGSMVKNYPELAREELRAGHIVGNHTLTHADLPTLTPDAIERQIQQSSDEIEQAIGVRPTFIRPPYGDVNSVALTYINSLALTIVLWSDEAQDWALPGTSVIVARILSLASNGAIILLHDGGGMRAQTVQALPTIIEQLRARGYTFVKMDELVAHMHEQKSAEAPSSTRR